MFLHKAWSGSTQTCCGTNTEVTFSTYWSHLNQNHSAWISLHVYSKDPSVAESTSGSLLGASVEVAVWRYCWLFLIFKQFTSQGALPAGNKKHSHGAVCVEFCGRCTCWMWWLANFGCTSFAKCTGLLWFKNSTDHNFLANTVNCITQTSHCSK